MIGSKGNEGIQNNVIRRARMWQKMVLYDNAKLSKDFGDKAADFLVSWSSLSYVAFNPFGNHIYRQKQHLILKVWLA